MRLILLAGTLLVLAAMALGYRSLVAPPPPNRMEDLREQLRVLREEAEACEASLERENEIFQAYDGEVNVLRARVAELEALHPDGVPADSYAVYLAVLDRYNDAVPGWTERADGVRAAWERCRERVDAHNLLADSIRLLLEAEGILVPTRIPAPEPRGSIR